MKNLLHGDFTDRAVATSVPKYYGEALVALAQFDVSAESLDTQERPRSSHGTLVGGCRIFGASNLFPTKNQVKKKT